MVKLVLECNNFFKDCGFPYAFCGGYALELFLNKNLRLHSDIDIFTFEEDRKNSVEFILNKGWNVYIRTGHMELTLITDSEDRRLNDFFTVWVIKPDCSFIKLNPVEGKENAFNYDILNDELLNLDFIEIIFTAKNNLGYICDKNKNITRELDKAILYNNGIPYLAPEIKLFIDSNPRYMELDYFKNKNRIDFESAAPFLSEESKNWLINALEKKYPEGNRRIEQLKALSGN
ncbi:MAG: hypothetical protein LBI03_10685 [Clostridiales bacterium]|jgi:hypothetical protein|nr:hypothetical protein [Clostridiales bacterium]